MIFQLSSLGQPLLLVILLVVIATVLYYYRPALRKISNFGVSKSIIKGNEEDEEKASEKVIKSLECPMCGKNMESGYLVSSGTISWSNQTPDTQFYKRYTSDYLDTFSRFSPLTSLEAYKCYPCDIIIINNKQNSIPDF